MRQRYVMTVSKPATVEATVVVTADDPENAKALARSRSRDLPCDAWTISTVVRDASTLEIVDTLPPDPPMRKSGSVTPSEGVPVLRLGLRRRTRRGE